MNKGLKSLDKDELSRLFSVIPHPLHRLAVRVTFNHGLRVSELTGLTAGDVKDGYLVIRRKKGSLETIQRVFSDERELEILSHSVPSETRLFPFSPRWFQILIKRYGEKAGIPAHKCTPHKLKHTCAMLGLEGGMKLNELQRHLGHKNLSSTGMYIEVTDDIASKSFAKAVGL